MQAALDYIRSFPCGRADLCRPSYEPENGAPRALYRSFGFREKGETDGEEIVAGLPLRQAGKPAPRPPADFRYSSLHNALRTRP